MHWNIITGEERLKLWKKLRDDIKDLPLTEQLNLISKFCAFMPIGSRTIDYYSPKNFPTPWDILFYGSFCVNSISLIIFYTLLLLSNTDVLELILIEDEDGIYLLPLINNQFVLNYQLGSVNNLTDIQNNFKIIKRYLPTDIRRIT